MCLAHLSCSSILLICLAYVPFSCVLHLVAAKNSDYWRRFVFKSQPIFPHLGTNQIFSLLDFNRLPSVKLLVIVDFSRFRPFLSNSIHFAFLIITPFRVGAQKCILAPSRSIYPNTHFSSPPQKHLCRGRNRHNRHNRHNRNMWFLHHEIQPPKT